MLGRGLQRGDLVAFLSSDLTQSAPDLLLKRMQETRSVEILFATVRCATTIEKLNTEPYFGMELTQSDAAPRVYLSAQAVRGHFYIESGDDSPQDHLYAALSTHPAAALTELRLAWRLKSIEISLSSDQRIKKSHIERAFNILANPALKELLRPAQA